MKQNPETTAIEKLRIIQTDENSEIILSIEEAEFLQIQTLNDETIISEKGKEDE